MVETKIKKLTAIFLAIIMYMTFWTYVPMSKVHAESQADALVSIALAEEGYTEGANNYSKYGEWYYNNVSKEIDYAHSQWCAMFISWCARQAGIPTSIIKNNAWAGSMGSSKRTGNFGGQYYPKGSITPQKGDIVYYGWGSSTSEHVEIVISTSGNTFTSIGGNTGGGTKVYIHKNYSFTSSDVVGYERPNYNNNILSYNINLNVNPGTDLQVTNLSWNSAPTAIKYGIRIYEADNWDNQVYSNWNHTGYNDSIQLSSGNYMGQCMYLTTEGGDWVFSDMIYFSIKSTNLFKPTINLDKSYYTVEDTVNISWNASPSDSSLSHYWVQVILPDGSYLLDEAFNARTTSCSFLAPTIGDYTIKTFATPLGSNSGEGSLTDEKKVSVFEKLAKPSIDFNKNYYTIGETIDITWQMSPLKSNISHYWVSVIAPDGSYLLDEAFNANTNLCSFKPLTIGEFTIKLYATPLGSVSGEDSEIDIKTVSVYDKMSKPIINTNKESYTINDIIIISWKPSSELSNLSHYWLVVKDPDGKEIIGETMNKNTSYSFSTSKSGEYTIITYATPIGSKEGEGSLTDTKTISVTKSIKGDINADDEFTISDIVLLEKWLLGVPDTELINWEAADLNKDGQLDAFDMIEMRKLLIQNSSLSAQ